MQTTWRLAAGAAIGLLSMTGCGSSGGEDDTASSTSSSPSSSSSAASEAVLATADSDLGDIVVDAQGMTVYVFDKDTAGSGVSACADTCLDNWPAVTVDDDESAPAVDGVTGEVGTIERDDGTYQVTLGGLPLYLYAADSQAGDVTGQGVGGIWWVVSPDGAKVAAAPAPAPASSSSSAPSSEPAAVPGY